MNSCPSEGTYCAINLDQDCMFYDTEAECPNRKRETPTVVRQEPLDGLYEELTEDQ